ncbi:hypothetical protein QT969_20525 [Rhodococcus sp. CSLK01-03]|uniref:Uncharacterized protein n=1 Tax=Rhodococcus indonesiensis TaxID=3055869 RepID=A0ABT7RSQ2_9NOCA|nr:hypothetical protein [Rhodococcus indonesiensis]MDM7490675.1 hypothetical protein [Rhodococcus indonesiensis]
MEATDRPAPVTGEDLENLVDDMEKRVESEREEEGVEGSISDREQQRPIESGDEAPD